MQVFDTHVGLVAPLDRVNVDTDQIIPKQFLKSIKRTGFGDYLFDAWRFDDPGELGMTPNERVINHDFVLNQPRYQGASILLARNNFGCGSSREHAVWSIMEFGFKVVIAESFADIFYGNCFKNGLLPVQLPSDVIDRLFELSSDGLELSVDLPNQTVTEEAGEVLSFDIDQGMKTKLLEGQDEISLSLKEREKILLFEGGHKKRQPWLFDRKSG